MGTQCSTETDSHAEMMTDNVNGKEDCNCKSTPESAARAHYGNENGEKKLLRMEENQEASALEKKGIDEEEKTKPEDLTAREDTRISHENIMAMQHQNPEVNVELKQTVSGESNMNEEEKCAPVPWGSRALNREDGSEECPGEEGGECSPSACLSCCVCLCAPAWCSTNGSCWGCCELSSHPERCTASVFLCQCKDLSKNEF